MVVEETAMNRNETGSNTSDPFLSEPKSILNVAGDSGVSSSRFSELVGHVIPRKLPLLNETPLNITILKVGGAPLKLDLPGSI